ncbi:MAG: cytochrome-c peroxidase [Bacteroidetes bacterium]|nr:cytochrome-c peroxidase [Bacteroidota bacterium]
MKKVFVTGILLSIIMLFQLCRVDDTAKDLPIATPYNVNIPDGFPPMDIPADNPLTVEGIELGKRLFYDPILSGDSTQACASCHNQNFAFTDSNNQFSKGITGAIGNKNAMALFNLGWQRGGFFWNGRAATLEEQVQKPVENPIEMHENWGNALKKIKRSKFYPELYIKAFGKKGITQELSAKAMAQFLRTIISSTTKYDLVKKHLATFTNSEKDGEFLFLHDPKFDAFGVMISKGADCFHCHGAPMFQELNPQLSFRNNGLSNDQEIAGDMGFGAVSDKPEDYGKFKVPSLRNIALTAPYMHDGRFKTLEEVIAHYNAGGKPSITIDPLMASVQFKKQGGKLKLTGQDVKDLVAFLNTLTDTTFIRNKAFSNPFK